MKYRLIGLMLITIAVTGCNLTQKTSSENNSVESTAMSNSKITENDLNHLRYCVVLAEEALEAGDEPFGSILVNQNNEMIATARNRVNEINALAHPEIELANWAAENLSEEERRNTTMYTSGEHCPMCAAAHGLVGLGKIVYLSSTEQLGNWLNEVNSEPAPINFIPIENIIKNSPIYGPVNGRLLQEIKDLQLKYQANNEN